MATLNNILVPIDFSPCSVAALNHAFGLSEISGAHIDVLHVWQPKKDPSEDEQAHAASSMTCLSEACEQMRTFLKQLSHAGNEIHGRLESGNPSDAILSLADSGDYDLVVMGAHGHSPIAHRGSVADIVARHAPCPVLTIHAESENVASPNHPDNSPTIS